MEYMIRFTQTHETFRLAEIEALAVLEGIKLEVLSYSPSVRIHLTIYKLPLMKFQVAILLRETRIRGSS
jgi:tRNA G10  N-methylase Trm11